MYDPIRKTLHLGILKLRSQIFDHLKWISVLAGLCRVLANPVTYMMYCTTVYIPEFLCEAGVFCLSGAGSRGVDGSRDI